MAYRRCQFPLFSILWLFININQRAEGSDLREAVCDSVINLSGPASHVVSPGNYTSYEKNLDCQWSYEGSDQGDVILYKFYDVAIDCGDGLSAYDGNSISNNKLQSDLCTTGSRFSTPLQTTSGRHLLVRFQTDSVSKDSEKGFFTRAVSGRDLSRCPTTMSKVTLMASSTERFLTSPNFPQQYSNNYICEWNITAENGDATIQLKFYFIDIDTDGNRCFDSVAVYDENGQNITEVCGSEIFSTGDDTLVRSSGNWLRIVFKSDNLQTEHGFKLGYSQIVPPTTTTTTITTTSMTTTSTTMTTTTTKNEHCQLYCGSGKPISNDLILTIIDGHFKLLQDCSTGIWKHLRRNCKCKELYCQIHRLCLPSYETYRSLQEIISKFYLCLSKK